MCKEKSSLKANRGKEDIRVFQNHLEPKLRLEEMQKTMQP